MNRSRLLRTSLPLLMLGAAVGTAWVAAVGGRELLEHFSLVKPMPLAMMATLTLACLLVRFIRWQYLLRRVEVRLPARSSLAIYLASLVGIATPGYVGELLRGVLIRRHFRVSFSTTTMVLVQERLFDVIALALIGVLTVDSSWMRNVLALVVVGVYLLSVLGSRFALRFGIAPSKVTSMRSPTTVTTGLVLSLLAWFPPALMVSFAASSIGVAIPTLDGVSIFATTTLLGGMTLMPAGVGSTGSLAIVELSRLGILLQESVTIVSLVRLATVGLSLALAGACSAYAWRRPKLEAGQSADHFDAIAEDYEHQLPKHVWVHLIENKVARMASALDTVTGLGLDVGCGLGAQRRAMNARGYRVIGLDPATALLVRGSTADQQLLAGSALQLPLRSQSLDFAYAIGSLHHFEGEQALERALDELRRVLRSGALLVVHETNPANPVFRFYMGYLFPLLKSIDEGVETWIAPEQWKRIEGFDLVDLTYFTFIPDFVPAFMMKPLLALQRALERSPVRRYSVHYMAVLRRTERNERDSWPNPGGAVS